MYDIVARTVMLPGDVDFNCARPVFFACWYVGEMATWLTRLVSKTKKLKPKSDMNSQENLESKIL